MKLKPYPNYKDSEIKWIGKIPSNWKRFKIKHIAEYINGYAFKPEDWGDTGRKIIRIQNLTNHDNDYNKYSGNIDPKYLIKYGDIMLSWSASLGVFVWRDKQEGVLNQHIFKVVPNNNLVSDKFYIYLAMEFIEQLENKIHGSTMQHLTKDAFGSFVIFLPPLQEQRNISRYLDNKISHIENILRKDKKLVKLYSEKKDSLTNHLISKGLKSDSEMKNSGVNWIGNMPKSWNIERAKVIFNEVDDRSISGQGELLSVSHITGVTKRSEKVVNMFLSESLEGYKKCKKNDLVINTMWAWMGAIGVSFQKGLVSPSYNVYRFRKDDFIPKYYDYLFRTPRFKSIVKSKSKGVWTSRLRLYPESFFDIKIPVPPKQIQKIISNYLDKEVEKIDLTISQINKHINLLSEYKKSLIHHVVTGKVDVRGVNT